MEAEDRARAHNELEIFLVGKIKEGAEFAVHRAQRTLIEEIVRDEIRKQLERFIFTIAIPKDAR